MSAYYNEHDPKAAAWLRELIKANLIAPGEVDERSIEDILPSELDGFTQCHFFAGIGVWSYALRCAGWPDDRKVWTGSCPCQPFSAAGKGGGTDDKRHLWPSFFWLIKQCQPSVIFGEQVASKDGLAWLDIVQSDLEAEKYAVAPFDLCAAGFGAPHIRQRLFFVADSTGDRRARQWSNGSPEERWEAQSGIARQLSPGFERRRIVGELADANGQQVDAANEIGTGATNGFWRNAEWLYCRDEKYRAVEPGTFPLANGAAARVGRLRGYGNAIVAPVAEEFIRAYLEQYG